MCEHSAALRDRILTGYQAFGMSGRHGGRDGQERFTQTEWEWADDS